MRQAGALFAAMAALYAAAVAWPAGRRLDSAARAADPDTTRVGELLTALVGVLGFASMLAATLVLLALAHARGEDRLFAVAALLIGANFLAQALKVVLGQIDVFGGEDLRAYGGGFFPSGHATAATSLAFGLLLAVPPRLRPAAVVAGATAAALVGAGIVVRRSHTAGDVLGAFLLVTAWATVLLILLDQLASSARASGGRRVAWHPAPWGVAVVAVVGLAAALSDRSGASAVALAAAGSVQAAVAFAGLALVSRGLDRLEAPAS